MIADILPLILSGVAVLLGLLSGVAYLSRKGGTPGPAPAPPVPLPDVKVVEKEIRIEEKAREERGALEEKLREREAQDKAKVEEKAKEAGTLEEIVELLKEAGKR